MPKPEMETMPVRPLLLLIEDDVDAAAVLADYLAMEGIAIAAVESAVGAAALVRLTRPAAVVLDLGLPQGSGAALLAELKADPAVSALPVIVLADAGDAAALRPTRAAQMAAVLEKPLDLDDLLAAVRAATARPTGRPRGEARQNGALRPLQAVGPGASF